MSPDCRHRLEARSRIWSTAALPKASTCSEQVTAEDNNQPYEAEKFAFIYSTLHESRIHAKQEIKVETSDLVQ